METGPSKWGTAVNRRRSTAIRRGRSTVSTALPLGLLGGGVGSPLGGGSGGDGGRLAGAGGPVLTGAVPVSGSGSGGRGAGEAGGGGVPVTAGLLEAGLDSGGALLLNAGELLLLDLLLGLGLRVAVWDVLVTVIHIRISSKNQEQGQ